MSARLTRCVKIAMAQLVARRGPMFAPTRSALKVGVVLTAVVGGLIAGCGGSSDDGAASSGDRGQGAETTTARSHPDVDLEKAACYEPAEGYGF